MYVVRYDTDAYKGRKYFQETTLINGGIADWLQNYVFRHDKYQTPCSPYLIIYGDNRVIV